MDWSMNLNNDLFNEIVSRLDSYADYTRLRATCKIWWSCLPRFPINLLPCELPCLMLTYSTHSDFFSVLVGEHGKVYKLAVPLVENKVCRGSSKGWLVTLEDSPSIHLLNPLKPDTPLELPPVYTIADVVDYRPENTGAEYVIRVIEDCIDGTYENAPASFKNMKHTYIHKVVLSCSPTKTNCLALAIFGVEYKLACCRVGDERWKVVEQGWMSHAGGWWSLVEDIIHHDDKFYIVDVRGSVIVLRDEEVMDERSPTPQLVVRAPDGFSQISGGRLYLVVESPDELLMVNRDIRWSYCTKETYNFDIFKLDLNSSSWSKVESLGEYVLFLGVNESFKVSSGSLPCSSSKGNCIYFTEGYFDLPRRIIGGSDVGVFDLKNRSILTLALPVPGYRGRKTRIWPSPLWIRPSSN